MSIQIFKKKIPNELIFEFLDKICFKNDIHFIFNSIAFKKGMFFNHIEQFFNELKPYYHNSKKKYVEKKITYTSVTTVLRQICNFNKIVYTSHIKYDKSVYDIEYIIYK
jgi:hypothetical protein